MPGVRGVRKPAKLQHTVKSRIIVLMCYVVGVASSGMVWCFFVFLCLSEGLSSSFFAAIFAPFPR